VNEALAAAATAELPEYGERVRTDVETLLSAMDAE